MSTYVLMKVLESVPDRYDKGIRFITFGKIDGIYDRLTSHIKKGQRVLDIGCGTGALTLRALERGAKVKAIDINVQMLEIARKRISETEFEPNSNLCEIGVAELENEESRGYDVVMSGLCFSELSEDELTYTLKEVKRILKPGGILLVADEIESANMFRKFMNRILRFPLKAVTYLLTQTGTKAVKKLPDKIIQAGLIIETIRYNKMENFVELVACNPEEDSE